MVLSRRQARDQKVPCARNGCTGRASSCVPHRRSTGRWASSSPFFWHQRTSFYSWDRHIARSTTTNRRTYRVCPFRAPPCPCTSDILPVPTSLPSQAATCRGHQEDSLLFQGASLEDPCRVLAVLHTSDSG